MGTHNKRLYISIAVVLTALALIVAYPYAQRAFFPAFRAVTVSAQDTVYYTPNGKSYHSTKECPTLARSSKIYSAAKSKCPKKDACDNCVRQ